MLKEWELYCNYIVIVPLY